MMRLLLAGFLVVFTTLSYAQTTYYWVGGGSDAPVNISTGSNWKTNLDGSGTSRPSSTGATDILIFDGSNLGGATPVTGPIHVNVNSGITAAQMHFINNANVTFSRGTSGTSTITLNGGEGEDFVIEAGSKLTITTGLGSTVFAMAPATTSRVSGDFSMITGWQARFGFTSAAGTRSLVFTNGATFTTNITAVSTAYAFGNSTQTAERWVTFEAGSHLYYEGGSSPMGSNSTFMPIDFKTGSFYHMRASNPVGSGGSFFNNKSFANLIVENGATLTADGPINRIENLTITAGTNFITHTNGQTGILGNLLVDGNLTAPNESTNDIVLAGSTPQTISGAGTFSIASLVVANNAAVILERSINVSESITVYGKLDFKTHQLTGNATFEAVVNETAENATGNLSEGTYVITGAPTTISGLTGLTISGAGLAPNTSVVGYSAANGTIFLSKPILTSGSAVALTFSSNAATLVTSNTNGFNPVSGSIVTTGTKKYENDINYILNASTSTPFGISDNTTIAEIRVGSVIVNAPVTTNTSIQALTAITLHANRFTIRAADTVRVATGAQLIGTFGADHYIITEVDAATGQAGALRIDGKQTPTVYPIGTAAYYLPVIVTPANTADFYASVFEGVTANGLPNGDPLPVEERDSIVNVTWIINPAGSATADILFTWNAALESAGFSALSNEDIGIARNPGGVWLTPAGNGDNTANTATGVFNDFGAFHIAFKPEVQGIIFDPLPVKSYGDADLLISATSINTDQPITYTSNNPAVATIVDGDKIRVVGIGTTDITASQPASGSFPAFSVTQTLTVVKAALTIQADNKTKFFSEANPPLTITYTGFVKGETNSVLTTQAVISTTATTASPVGTYPITVSGATSPNYEITFVNGTLTVKEKQNQVITFGALPAKTYGNPEFAAGATSTNATIPITYTSSNTNVAVINGNNIRIVGAGTSVITAAQAGNVGYYAATPVTQTLTVNRTNLTIRAVDTSRLQSEPNPDFRLVYTGFVNGDEASSLTTPPSVSAQATTASPAGTYPIVVSNAVSSNYNITYTNGVLTVYPTSGTSTPSMHAFKSNSKTLTVRIYVAEQNLGTITIYDLNGRPLVTKSVFMPKGFINVEIPVGNLVSGVYSVVVTGQNLKLKKNVQLMR